MQVIIHAIKSLDATGMADRRGTERRFWTHLKSACFSFSRRRFKRERESGISGV